MSTPIESPQRDTYASIVTSEPEPIGTIWSVATLVAMLLVGVVLAVATQGWWMR